VLGALAHRLHERFPGLQLVAAVSPPYRPLSDDEARHYVAQLNAARPDVVWVGLSTPKQELWMQRWQPELDCSAVIGVGAAFDFHAGALRQAPAVLQRHGLEWAYRLAMEPKRLWRRYLRNNPAFLAQILRRPPHLAPDAG
jgi:N-acetylglucosaminyldiphosphoundecaprenol N-acetyl-beta-D-mannosaminyltransferase